MAKRVFLGNPNLTKNAWVPEIKDLLEKGGYVVSMTGLFHNFTRAAIVDADAVLLRYNEDDSACDAQLHLALTFEKQVFVWIHPDDPQDPFYRKELGRINGPYKTPYEASYALTAWLG